MGTEAFVLSPHDKVLILEVADSKFFSNFFVPLIKIVKNIKFILKWKYGLKDTMLILGQILIWKRYRVIAPLNDPFKSFIIAFDF